MSERNSADIFSSLLSDPAALSGIAALLSKAQPPTAQTDSMGDASASDKKEEAAQGADLSGIIGSVMSNPELMAALPSVIGALSGMLGTGADARRNDPAPSETPVGALPVGGMFGRGGAGAYPSPPRPTDRRSALLLALKPYMPEDKRESIDTIVRIIEIMTLIK